MRVIVSQGHAAATMQAIAEEAHASKETLYAWFGDREALVAALIRANADASSADLSRSLGQPVTDPAAARATLEGYARALLTLLTGDVSVALNRAAMSSPALAAELLDSGRHRVGPIAVSYLAELYTAGVSPHPDAPAAFSFLYGLVVQDTQIRTLLGEPAPSSRAIADRARWAVRTFLAVDPL
jgi:AcrR family transcriptional regulator